MVCGADNPAYHALHTLELSYSRSVPCTLLAAAHNPLHVADERHHGLLECQTVLFEAFDPHLGLLRTGRSDEAERGGAGRGR